MIYNIPEWPKDSDIKHTKTTWVLARDEDFANIEKELDESEDCLLVWEVDEVIPTGEIWYIKALRKLEDSDGNDLGNTKWIGPKPVYSEESSVNEYLAPKFYISTPYISELNYKEDEYLDIKLTPYKTNVGYINTSVTVEDMEGNVLATKFQSIDDNDTVRITNAAADLGSMDTVRITIFHTGTQSTISAPAIEVVNLKSGYYKLTGNLKNLDPTYVNTVSVKSTTYIGITVKTADITDANDNTVVRCGVRGPTITIPDTLEFNNSYFLKLGIEYTDADSDPKVTTATYQVTTKDTEEIIRIDDTVVYDGVFDIRSNEVYDDNSKFDLSINFNTEELFTYTIPMPDSATNKVSLFGLNKDLYTLSKHIENILEDSTDFYLRLLTKTTGFMQTTNDNGIAIITPFTYDSFKDTMVVSDAIDTGLLSSGSFVSRMVQLPSGFYYVGIDKDNDKDALIKKYDPVAKTLTDVITYTLPDSCSDITISNIGRDRFLMVPRSSSDKVFRFYIYSAIQNYINDSIAIPSDFRDKNLLVQSLYNGNAFILKHNDAGDHALDYCIYDVDAEAANVTNIDLDSDGKVVTNMIALKNGSVLTIVKNTEDDTDYAEFWVYK